MKKQVLILILLLGSAISNATTYYVSSSGSDLNNGTSSISPFATLTKVNSLNLLPGDNVLFKCGNTWYGTLNITKSGSVGNPITYGAYGTGEKPVITGFTAVTSWNNLGSNIWESTDVVSTLETCNMVTINGINTAMGKYPNSGYFTYQSNATNSITSSDLDGVINWTGAELMVRCNYYFQQRATITSQSGSTINFSNSVSLANGYGFWIQNDIRTLDAQNEWYFNPTTKKIRIYSTSQPSSVNVASVQYLIHFSNTNSPTSYVTIKGIDLIGANDRGIFRWSFGLAENRAHHLFIDNCNISFCGINGISIRGNYTTIKNCLISDINGNGINVGSNAWNTIEQNTISNIGLNLGMIQTGSEFYYGSTNAINTQSTQNSSISYNTITNCGYNGINFGGQTTRNTTIKNNRIDNYCVVTGDGGGIYGSYHSSAIIDGNIISNGIAPFAGTNQSFAQAVGIYLDDNTDTCEVKNNTIYNVSCYGLQYNSTSNINTHHNTVYASGRNELRLQRWSGELPLVNNDFLYNKFITKSASQKVISVISYEDDIPTFGVFDHNYYVRPLDNTTIISINQPSTGSASYTLAQWKTFSSQDANSFGTPKTVSTDNDLYFYYNPTNHDSTVVLTQPGMDVTGQLYSSPITLSPYSSIVIIRDNSNGTYYYISSSTGNDSNAGTIDAPWQTLGKLNAFTHAANDRVLFKCGDSWFGEFRPRSGSASGRLIYSSYGTGAKPLIHNSYTDKTWTLVSGNIWSTVTAVETANVIFNDTKCGVRKWSQAALISQDDWFYDSANGLLKMYSYANPTSVYSQIRVVNATNACTMNTKSYTTIDGLAFKYSGYGFVGSPVSNVTIQNCDVAWCGGQEYSNPVRKGNGIEFYYGCSNILVQNCKVWECFDAGITAQSIGNSYALSNITFRNNQVWNCEYSFEYFNSGTSTSTSDFLIENNTCYNAGGGWGHTQRSDPSGYHIRIAEQPTTTIGFVIKNNLFNNSTAECVHTWATDYSKYTSDYNLFYRPSGNIVGINFTNYYTQSQFSNYKSATGWDAHSSALTPSTISDLTIYRNDTNAQIILPLGSPKVDSSGQKKVSSVVLPAYTPAFLLVDHNPDATTNPTGKKKILTIGGKQIINSKTGKTYVK